MARIYLVTSFKGGVGKSTVAANLAARLALMGNRVLLCDLDFGLRNLDLITASEDRAVFDICDVVYERRGLYEAAVTFDGIPGLYLLAAPFRPCEIEDTLAFASRIKEISREFDFVVLDTPGADTCTLDAAVYAADLALVVAAHQPTSLRGAERTASRLMREGLQSRLIINCFDPGNVLSGSRPGMVDTIEKTGIPLIGVIPNDRALSLAQEKGRLALEEKKFISSRAFSNIAQRLLSEITGEKPLPILYKVHVSKRKKLLTK